MSIVDVCAVDKETGRPASRECLERHFQTIDSNMPTPTFGSDGANYAIKGGSVQVSYFRNQTAVAIIAPGEIADEITSPDGPFNWYPND